MFTDAFLNIIVPVVVLGVLIFVHELGHFLLAKLCGVGVLEFSIGFGKKIWQHKLGETMYAIGLIPLGGYVRMLGDDPEEVSKKDQSKENITTDKSRWFLEKGYFAKCAVVLAGPFFNLFFAYLIAVLSFAVYGKMVPLTTPQIGNVIPEYPADKAGLKVGDFILSIDGTEIHTWEELSKRVELSGGKELSFLIERSKDVSGGKVRTEIRVAPTKETAELRLLDDSDDASKKKEFYKIGINPGSKRVPVSITEASVYGGYQVLYLSKLTIRVLSALVTGLIEPQKVIGGPISVFTGAAHSARKGLEFLLDFMVLLSVSLAIFNLIPIPVLDGGHILFFSIEALKGSPVGLRWQVLANQIGMALLIILMIFAVSNDVIRIGGF